MRLGCFTACHVDAANLGGQEAERVRELFDRHRLELSSLGYDNPLHPDPAVRNYPGNLAYSPELWEWMFSLGVELNVDPSHLVWLGVDPVEVVRPYLDRIPHAQAKDVETDPRRRNRYGVFGKALREDPWDPGWWRYRVPGLGEVDWRRLVDAMYEGGFDGVFSVEHEDPVWGGDEERVKAGLAIAHRTLRPLLVR